MFIDEIEGKHGKVEETEKQWISENLEKLNDSDKLNILRELENYKVITLKVLKDVYKAVTGKQAKGFQGVFCQSMGRAGGSLRLHVGRAPPTACFHVVLSQANRVNQEVLVKH